VELLKLSTNNLETKKVFKLLVKSKY